MLRLAWPIVLAELGWVVMGIVDTIVVGRLPYSADAIAAVSLGTILFNAIGIFGSGLLLGLDTLVSHAVGAGDRRDQHRSLVGALYLIPPIAVVLMLVLRSIVPLAHLLGERPEVMRLMVPYFEALSWSTLPLLVYFGLRRYLQSMNVVRPVMFALISANLVNLFGNWVLVYGHLGMPAFGVPGSAWATVISRIYMAGVLVLALLAHDWPDRTWPWELDFRRMRRLLMLGVPAGSQMLVELAIFAVAAVMIGRIDSASLAAHQIALNAAAFTFMVTVGIGSAGAVRVGQALGRKDTKAASVSGWTAMSLGVSFMGIAAIVFLLFPEELSRIYTSDPVVIHTSVSLLAVAALFQIFDGTQVVLSGVLRGAGDTHTAMMCHLVGYWAFGLPLGYLLCFPYGWGAVGIWSGLCGGLMLIGTVLLAVWMAKVRRWRLARIPALQP